MPVHSPRPARGPLLAALGVAAAGIAGAGAYGAAQTRRLVVEEPAIEMRGSLCRPAYLRVLHLCDLHLQRQTGLVERVMATIGRLRYDLALLGGDLADSPAGRTLALQILTCIRAPLGVFAVPGNHDRFQYTLVHTIKSTINEPLGGPISKGIPMPLEPFARQMEDAGVRVLRNENVRLDLPEGALWLLGMDDEHSSHHDLDATLQGVPANACRLLLTHSPDPVHAVAARGVPLMLAGHTHGGQIVLPGLGALESRTRLRLRRPFGLFRFGDCQLYINRGAGGSVPFRLNCPPEIALIHLRIVPG